MEVTQSALLAFWGSVNYTEAVYLAWGDHHHSYKTWPLQVPEVAFLQNNRCHSVIQEIQDWLSARFQSINKP